MLPEAAFTSREQHHGSSSGAVVLPVTCAELHNFSYDSNQLSSTSPLRIGSLEPKYVKVVGFVVSSDTSKASWTISMDDGTSTLQVSVYPDSERIRALAAKDRDGLSPGSYLSVLGCVRREPAVSLFALDVRQVEDFNEVTSHYLSAALAYERSTVGALPSVQGVQSPLASGTETPTFSPEPRFVASPRGTEQHTLFSPYRGSGTARASPSSPLPSLRKEGGSKPPALDSLGVYSRIMLSLVSARGSCSREDLFSIMASNGYGDEGTLDSTFSELILSNRLVTLDGIHFRATGN